MAYLTNNAAEFNPNDATQTFTYEDATNVLQMLTQTIDIYDKPLLLNTITLLQQFVEEQTLDVISSQNLLNTISNLIDAIRIKQA
jgi:hypothetical protein